MDVRQHVLNDPVHRQRDQDALAQRLLVEQRGNSEPVGLEKLLAQPDQLDHQVFQVAGEVGLQLGERLARGDEQQALRPEFLGQLLQVDRHRLRQVRRAAQGRRQVGADVNLCRIDPENQHLLPVDRKHRLDHDVHARDVGPTDLQGVALGQRLDLRAGLRRRGSIAAPARRIRPRHCHPTNSEIQELVPAVLWCRHSPRPCAGSPPPFWLLPDQAPRAAGFRQHFPGSNPAGRARRYPRLPSSAQTVLPMTSSTSSYSLRSSVPR